MWTDGGWGRKCRHQEIVGRVAESSLLLEKTVPKGHVVELGIWSSRTGSGSRAREGWWVGKSSF